MAEIFLTGATGFVGQHLTPKLVEAGHRVRCLARSRAALLRGLGCEITLGDLLQPGSWQDSLASIETIIHLASLHTGPPELIERTNAEGTALLVSAAEKAGIKRFLYLSTLTASNKPSWLYAYSTWLAERAIQQSSLDYTILRCSVIVGPGDPFLGGIIQVARTWPVVPIIGSGQTKFQPIYVGDVARCLVDALTQNSHSRKLLTIGGPEILSYEQIVDAVLEALDLQKRKIHLPRRPMRWLVRRLERWSFQTPFAPGHFLSRHHLASSPTVVEEEFGFQPRTLRALLAQQPPNLLL